MIKHISLICSVVMCAVSAQAYTPAQIEPTFVWVTNPTLATGFDSVLGVGILNSDFTTGSGTSLFFDASGTYAVNEQLGFSLHIPLAGTIAQNSDGVGLGNISLQAKYFLPTQGNLLLGVATDVAFATATNDATIGAATRRFYRYVRDQWAVVPRLIAGMENDNLRLTGQVGVPLQILETNAQVDGDSMEAAGPWPAPF